MRSPQVVITLQLLDQPVGQPGDVALTALKSHRNRHLPALLAQELAEFVQGDARMIAPCRAESFSLDVVERSLEIDAEIELVGRFESQTQHVASGRHIQDVDDV